MRIRTTSATETDTATTIVRFAASDDSESAFDDREAPFVAPTDAEAVDTKVGGSPEDEKERGKSDVEGEEESDVVPVSVVITDVDWEIWEEGGMTTGLLFDMGSPSWVVYLKIQ